MVIIIENGVNQSSSNFGWLYFTSGYFPGVKHESFFSLHQQWVDSRVGSLALVRQLVYENERQNSKPEDCFFRKSVAQWCIILLLSAHPKSIKVSHGVVASILDCDNIVREFKLKSCCYVHFGTNTLRKGMNPVKPHFQP